MSDAATHLSDQDRELTRRAFAPGPCPSDADIVRAKARWNAEAKIAYGRGYSGDAYCSWGMLMQTYSRSYWLSLFNEDYVDIDNHGKSPYDREKVFAVTFAP